MLTTGARGVNAPQMTPLDAARVLLVLLVSGRPADSPKAVRDFGTLPRTGCPNLNQTGYDFKLEPSDGCESFEEDLAAVIQKLADVPERSSWTDPPEIYVSASINDRSCRIELPGMVYKYSRPGDKVNQAIPRIKRAVLINGAYVFDEIVDEEADRKLHPVIYQLRDASLPSKIRVRRELNQDVLVPISVDFVGGK
jgi:hypothetical protein